MLQLPLQAMPCLKRKHSHPGSGQIIDQGARLVDIALDDGSAFTGDGWKYISSSFEKNTVHFIGLLSDGGVHSRYDQLAAFVKGAQKHGAKRIRVHFLTVISPSYLAILQEPTLLSEAAMQIPLLCSN